LKQSCSIIEPEYLAQTYTTPDCMTLSRINEGLTINLQSPLA
jgi:hypothetical protein